MAERRWARYAVEPGQSDGRRCENCGDLLIRRMFAREAEAPKTFERRRYCSVVCRAADTSRQWVDSDGPPWTLDPSGCWPWNRKRNAHGYGVLSIRGHSILAYAWVYRLEVGLVPEGLQLDHLCRNRACVNPGHLEPVTHIENLRRGAKPKLSVRSADAIRRSALSSVVLADAYGVAPCTISRVRAGTSWFHPEQKAAA